MNIDLDRLVRERERRELTGIPASTWVDLVKAGLAPPALKISRGAVAWPHSELAALNAARISGKSDDEIKALVKRLVAKRAHAFDRFEDQAA